MPQKRIQTKFGKAARTPSEHKEPKSGYRIPMNKPKPRSSQLEFVESNRTEPRAEAETRELVLTLQDTCKHERQRKVIATGPSKKFLQCPDCGQIKTEAKH